MIITLIIIFLFTAVVGLVIIRKYVFNTVYILEIILGLSNISIAAITLGMIIAGNWHEYISFFALQ